MQACIATCQPAPQEMQSAASFLDILLSDFPEVSTLHQVPWERLRVVDLGRPVLVGGTRVTFLDANHCPGGPLQP